MRSDSPPFGMVMPGRSNSSSAYRFGFNGKENDNEVKGIGNSVHFGDRICDTRLGRWLSIDPFFKKSPYNSPYVAFDNDPISTIDINGDTTVYYSQNGTHLGTTYDKLPTAVSIIADANLKGFIIGYGAKPDKERSSNKNNQEWRKLAYKNFDIKTLRKFYNDHTIKGINDKNPQSETGHYAEGYFREYRTYLYEKNGQIEPGSNAAEGSIDWVSDYPPKEPGKIVGKVHTHPNEGKPSKNWVPFAYGPSPEDINNSGETDVIVGRKNIYIYGSELKKITIDKKTLEPVNK